ncbi:hypothetical protein EUTSA_v10002788mg, partial [Eutrema salsugineum]
NNGGVTLDKLLKVHLQQVNTWTREDRLRLIYICTIAGFVMAQDAQILIRREYIILAMDITKLQKYPWGIHAYDHLVDNIIKTREKLSQMKGYHLDGFSIALQIWVMEAIPDFGTLLATRVGTEDTFIPRCTKWKRIARVSYNDISQLESTFKSHHLLFPYISATGNCDVVDSSDFLRLDEMNGRVDVMKSLISQETDWSVQIWEVEDANIVNELTDGEQDNADLESEKEQDDEAVNGESEIGIPNGVGSSASGSARWKKWICDYGATTRKQKLLCERSRESMKVLDDDIKTWIQSMFDASIAALEERIEKKIDEKLNQIENQITLSMEKLNNSFNVAGIPKKTSDTSTSNETPVVNTSPPIRKSSRVNNPEPAKTAVNSDGERLDFDDLSFSQIPDLDLRMGTQEFLQKTMGHLSQDTLVDGLFPTQPSMGLTKILSPKTVGKKSTKTPFTILHLKDSNPQDLADNALVYVPDDSWDKFFT